MDPVGDRFTPLLVEMFALHVAPHGVAPSSSVLVSGFGGPTPIAVVTKVGPMGPAPLSPLAPFGGVTTGWFTGAFGSSRRWLRLGLAHGLDLGSQGLHRLEEGLLSVCCWRAAASSE